MAGPGLITAEAAARILGIKRASLYTYVSRGILRPIRDGKSGSLYLSAEVLGLKARSEAHKDRSAAAKGALRWGEPVIDTAISSIDVDGPNYRGVPALTLAEDLVPFEAVAEHLWGVDRALHGVAAWPVGSTRTTGPARGFRTRLSQELAQRLDEPDPPHKVAAGRELIAAFASLWSPTPTSPDPRSPPPGIAARIASAAGLPDEAAADLNAALVLCADHELNASTFAARVVASTGAALPACLLAALSALGGPLHGGLSEVLEAWLHAAGSPPEAVAQRLDAGEGLPGWGHPLYPGGDPRAEHLIALARRRGGARLDRLLAFDQAAREAGVAPPNLDFGLVALCSAWDLPEGSAAALFAVGRCAGWVAHVGEQRESGQLLRPRARYVGP